jgi:threonine dehydratase
LAADTLAAPRREFHTDRFVSFVLRISYYVFRIPMYDVPFSLIERVAPAVKSRVLRTPLLPSPWLSSLAGAEVWLKCENLQLTHSFKVRGPFAKFADVPGLKRVVAASAGNHGQGLAYAARAYGAGCTIYVPRTIAAVKENAIRSYGAELVKAPFDGYDETEAYARERVGDATWVSPFDDPHIIAGNGGTTALDILDELDAIDAFVLACGGGGMAIGVGVVARQLCPAAKVIGVNSEASPGMFLSRRDGHAHLKIDSKPTIAEGIEGGVAETTYRLGLKFIDDVVCVSEASIRRAVVDTLARERQLIEGSAAAAIAAVAERKFPGSCKRIVVVLSGGNIDLERVKGLL